MAEGGLVSCNNTDKCEDCGRPMSVDEKGWLEFDGTKLFCLDCRTEDGVPTQGTAAKKKEPGVKKVIVEHRSEHRKDLVDRLKKDVRALEIRATRTEAECASLRKIVKHIYALVRGKGDKPGTLDEERMALRRRSG